MYDSTQISLKKIYFKNIAYYKVKFLNLIEKLHFM
jgi:hypothetical protein